LIPKGLGGEGAGHVDRREDPAREQKAVSGADPCAEGPDDLARVVDAVGLGRRRTGHIDRREHEFGVAVAGVSPMISRNQSHPEHATVDRITATSLLA
jgi:hypothetical protein